MVFSRFGSGRQSSQLQAQKASTLGSGTGASECAVWDRHAMVFEACPFRKRPPKPSAAGSESDVRQWHRGFGSAVGTGMPWYVFTRFGSGRQSRQLQASKASFLAGSESDVRQWHRGLGSAVGPACHGVYPFRKRPPKPSAAGFKGYSFLAVSESDVRHWHRGFGSYFS